MVNPEPVYANLAAESEDPDVTEIQSLCMQCHSMGMTRLLLTKIPHYKEVILSSFECDNCGERNNSIQRSSVQDLGIRYKLIVKEKEDLSRQIVKSDHATLNIPDLEFEIPAKGEITTVEGIIRKAVDGLRQNQDVRKCENNELFEQIDSFIRKLEALLDILSPFTIVIDDPTGESFVENLRAPLPDPQLTFSSYTRTEAQNQLLGFSTTSDSQNDDANSMTLKDIDEECEEEQEKESKLQQGKFKDEVLQFSTICSHCSRPSSTKMKVVDVPHFKEVVIMATECEFCNHKTNEVKSGSGMEPKGQRMSLRITQKEDLSRDVLKSETCSVSIPELELSVGAGIFVGKFTTVEGLLSDIQTDLSKNPFLAGDSASADRKGTIERLVNEMQKVVDGARSVELILDDPAGNSFIQDRYTPDKDPFLTTTLYERSFEQNEDLGINDMKTENYTVD